MAENLFMRMKRAENPANGAKEFLRMNQRKLRIAGKGEKKMKMRKWLVMILAAMMCILTFNAPAEGRWPSMRVDRLKNATAIEGRLNDHYDNALEIRPGVVYTEDVLTSNLGFDSNAGWNTGRQWYTFTAEESGQYTLFLTRDLREEEDVYFRMSIMEENKEVIESKRTRYGSQIADVLSADLQKGRIYYLSITSPVYRNKHPYIFTLCSPSEHAEAGENEMIRSADCIHEGCMAASCLFCGVPMHETILPATGEHNPGDSVILSAPTCTESGLEQVSCVSCGEILYVREIPAAGHRFGNWTITQMPTAEEPGYQTRFCEVCGEAEVKTLKLEQ